MGPILLFLTTIFCSNVVFGELDNASQEALEQTKKALINASEREKAFQENPKFKQGEAGADLLVKGNEAQKQQLYELAAKMLEELAQKTKGDPQKMQEMVSKGASNPAQFMQDHLTPEQQKQVRDLAAEIEKSRAPSPPQPSK